MKIGRVLMGVAVLGLFASPGLATEIVQLENWDGPFVNMPVPTGQLDDSWVNIGYGEPLWFAGDPVTKTEGTHSQSCYVPGEETFNTDPEGSAILVHPDTPVEDIVQLVQDLGGAEPDLEQPATLSMDIRVDVDYVGDYIRLDADLTFFNESFIGDGSKTDNIWDGLDGDPINQWCDDWPFAEFTQFPLTGLFVIFLNFEISTAYAGDCTFYLDDIKLTYEALPEPATLVLFGLGSVALLRRRR